MADELPDSIPGYKEDDVDALLRNAVDFIGTSWLWEWHIAPLFRAIADHAAALPDEWDDALRSEARAALAARAARPEADTP